jgi:adenylate cyclase
MNLRSVFTHAIGRGLLLGLFVTVLAVLFRYSNLFEAFELKTLDWRFRLLSSPEEASEDIVIIAVDQKSLDYYEELQSIPWPWPRGLYEAVISFVNGGGAKAVIFDILFTERSGYGYEDDEYFTEVVKDAGNVYIPYFLSQQERPVDEALVQILKAKRSIKIEDRSGIQWWTAQSVLFPLDELVSSAKGLGNVMMVPDGDGIYRRVPLLFKYQDHWFPSLPVAALEDILDIEAVSVDRSNQLSLGPVAIPLQQDGTMLVKYYGGVTTYTYYSIASVIQSYNRLEEGEELIVEPEEFKDKIVFVGLIAPGLYDLKPTPLSSVYPGVEVHATVLDNILHDDFLTRVGLGTTLLLILLLNLLCGIVVSSFINLKASLPLVGVLLMVPLVVAVLSFQSNLWLDVVAPEIGLFLTFGLTAVVNYATEGKQRRFIKGAFQHYLSPAVIDELVRSPERLTLGGEKKELTVLFSDIAGFTSISEQLTPEHLTTLLNEYLTRMTEIVLSYGGTLDKYEGDAIMAFWGAPLPQPDHARRACLAALDCQTELVKLRDEFETKDWPPLFARIGLNSGMMIVGNLGSRERFDYTVLGDEVNLASRLEGVNKAYGTQIMISERTYKLVKDDVEVRELDMIRVKGKDTPVRIYELLTRRDQLSADRCEIREGFQKGISAYRERKWNEAIGIFEGFPDDPPSRVFLSRCREYETSPPPEDWEGVYAMRTK